MASQIDKLCNVLGLRIRNDATLSNNFVGEHIIIFELIICWQCLRFARDSKCEMSSGENWTPTEDLIIRRFKSRTIST